MIKHRLSGLGTALITPFLPSGEVDFSALENLLERQIREGVDYLVVLGTTAESATLTCEERCKIENFILRRSTGRVPLVLGLGGNCTAAVVEQLQQHEQLEQFDAILSVCPYYNKPSQEGLYQHFAAIARASRIPVILYNVPGRTGVNLLPETVMRLQRDFPEKIIGIKEASGNVEQIKQLLALRDEQAPAFLVLSGDDGIAAELMQAGADGLISVASNYFTADFRQIVHQADQRLQQRYERMVELLFKEGNPAGIKTVLAQQGLIHNVLRLPLVRNSEAVQREISEELRIEN